jgi:chorismate synthase
MSQYGTAIPISIFGESHGESIGLTIHNLPAGITLNHAIINDALYKRRPKSKISTARQEKDQYRIISGILGDTTTGAPLTVIIPNKDTHSKDYNKYILRPSHSDYTAHMKYRSLHDHRGGGHFSGRITATLVILGAICQQILTKKDILIGSHIASIKDQSEDKFTLETLNKESILKLLDSDFPLLDTSKESSFKDTITSAKDQADSVGGVIETAVLNMPVGLGGPYFNKFESFLSGLIFSLPAVKGLAFGDGFDITTKYGSEANDPFRIKNGKIVTSSNHSGGVQGGITNGMPLTFSTAIKPTSSIGKPQKTVNFKTKEEIEYTLVGRHDPAIVHRVIHVINAITNYAMVEAITKEEGYKWMI